MTQHLHQRDDNVTTLRIVRAHAPQPEAVLLRAVEDWKPGLLDELVALGRREAHGISIALEIQEELGAVLVLPLARVHCSTPQTDDDRQVLDSDRALVFAGPARRA